MIIFSLLVSLNQFWLKTCRLVDIKLKFWEKKDCEKILLWLMGCAVSSSLSINLWICSKVLWMPLEYKKPTFACSLSWAPANPTPKLRAKFGSKNEVSSSCLQSQSTKLSSAKCSHDYLPHTHLNCGSHSSWRQKKLFFYLGNCVFQIMKNWDLFELITSPCSSASITGMYSWL